MKKKIGFWAFWNSGTFVIIISSFCVLKLFLLPVSTLNCASTFLCVYLILQGVFWTPSFPALISVFYSFLSSHSLPTPRFFCVFLGFSLYWHKANFHFLWFFLYFVLSVFSSLLPLLLCGFQTASLLPLFLCECHLPSALCFLSLCSLLEALGSHLHCHTIIFLL